jgi:hypothetical protein
MSFFREEDLVKKFAKLEQWKHDVRVKAAKKLAAVEAAKVGISIRYFPEYVVHLKVVSTNKLVEFSLS